MSDREKAQSRRRSGGPRFYKIHQIIEHLFAGGSVRLPQRARWLEEFIAELLAFPGRHNDQVDALTQGLAWGRCGGDEES